MSGQTFVIARPPDFGLALPAPAITQSQFLVICLILVVSLTEPCLIQEGRHLLEGGEKEEAQSGDGLESLAEHVKGSGLLWKD